MNSQVEVRVYDNGGRTRDRYTVVIHSSVYRMSVDAMSPQGINQLVPVLSEIDLTTIGRKLPLKDWPSEVKQAIIERAKEQGLMNN